MKNSKKAFILLLCLACAGQQARADWSWLTGSLGRLFAPVACHWGKVLIGLGAVAGISGGGALIKSWWNTKRRNDRLDKAVAGLEADEKERKAEELARQKKINDQQEVLKALDDKLVALKSAALENLKQLKEDTEKLNGELVRLGGSDQKEWIKLQLSGRLVVLMSDASQALDKAQDVPAIEGPEKQRVIMEEMVKAVGSNVDLDMNFSHLQLAMANALSRVCEKNVIADDEFKVGQGIDEQINDMWGTLYKQQLALVEKLALFDREKALQFYAVLARGRLDGGYDKLRNALLYPVKPKESGVVKGGKGLGEWLASSLASQFNAVIDGQAKRVKDLVSARIEKAFPLPPGFSSNKSLFPPCVVTADKLKAELEQKVACLSLPASQNQ